jgi:hypothetical protein
MKHKDVIFFSTLAVWVVFIFVIIVGGEALGIEHADTLLLGGELVFVFILTAVIVVAKLARRFGEWLDTEI